MGEGTLLVAFVTAQRLAEMAWAARNTRRLLQAGGVEFGRGHYPCIVALHGAWLAGLFLLGHDHAVDPIWLAAFIALQGARAWVLVTLGSRWTTRIVVVPELPAITQGPYRIMRHPNYLIVALEIAVVPLALGLAGYAAVFSALNAGALWLRIAAEDAALAWASTPHPATH